MYWTLQLASYLSDAPWPATREELKDYAIRTGAPLGLVEILDSIDDDGRVYQSIKDLWNDYPVEDDFLWNEDEY